MPPDALDVATLSGMGSDGASGGSCLLLLFTYGTTMQTWVNQGLLNRERRYYALLAEQGFQTIHALTYGRNDKALEAGAAPFCILPKRYVNHDLLFGLLAPFIYWRRIRSCDVVKTNQSRGAWVGLIIKLLLRPALLVVRCGWVRTDEMLRKHEGRSGVALLLAKLVEAVSFRLCDAIIVTAPRDKKYIQSAYRIADEKIHVIPNSVDTDLFKPGPGGPTLGEPLRVVTVGRLVPMKNVQGLIEALAGIGRKTELTVAGDGPYRSELEQLAERLGVRTQFLSFIDNRDLPALLREQDVFVMPQFYASGMTKVILEAMACGLITIVSDIGTHREVIEDGANGFICEPDPAALRICIAGILSLDQQTLSRISGRARRDVVEKYSMRSTAEREWGVYRKLLDERGLFSGIQ